MMKWIQANLSGLLKIVGMIITLLGGSQAGLMASGYANTDGLTLLLSGGGLLAGLSTLFAGFKTGPITRDRILKILDWVDTFFKTGKPEDNLFQMLLLGLMKILQTRIPPDSEASAHMAMAITALNDETVKVSHQSKAKAASRMEMMAKAEAEE